MADSPATATTYGARDHARGMAGTVVATMPTLPARAAANLPAGVRPREMLWEETVAGGGYTFFRLPRGGTVRLTDVDGDACAHLLAYNACVPTERLNVADTVKVQWQAYLEEGRVLLSDMGRVLLSIVGDTSGRHDAFCGATSRRANDERYGDGAVQHHAPNARDQFIVAAIKAGLSKRHVGPSVSLFKSVRVEPDGALVFDAASAVGATVDLQAEMDVLLIVVNSPHPLDERLHYTCTNLRVSAWQGLATTEDDALWASTPELERAFRNTEEFVSTAGRGVA